MVRPSWQSDLATRAIRSNDNLGRSTKPCGHLGWAIRLRDHLDRATKHSKLFWLSGQVIQKSDRTINLSNNLATLLHDRVRCPSRAAKHRSYLSLVTGQSNQAELNRATPTTELLGRLIKLPRYVQSSHLINYFYFYLKIIDPQKNIKKMTRGEATEKFQKVRQSKYSKRRLRR